MKKYMPLFLLWILFIFVASSCAMRHDSCSAYNRVDMPAENVQVSAD